MTRTWLLVLVAACAADPGDDGDCFDGKCDQSCADPRYADGVCDLTLACDAPDLDCFRTFADDAEGAAWFMDIEPRAAMAEGRPARSIVPLGDPRYDAVRALLDRGWDAMRDNRPVARLAEKRPALVLVEDPTVNAFVFPEDIDQKRASFAVMVHTGLLDRPTTDAANLGLMMHELQHAIGLHVVAEVKQRFETYYLADAGYEPIGRDQTEDADVREQATRWRALAGEVGGFSDGNLRGLPTDGDLQLVFKTVVRTALEANPSGCAHTRSLLTDLAAELQIDPVSGAPAVTAGFGAHVDAAFAALRDECAPDAPSFVEVVASIAGTTPEQIDAQLSAEDRDLIANQHVVDALAALVENRRAKMRAIEASAPDTLGGPWSALRYFSEEEDADDVSVPVLRAAGVDPAGLGTFLAEVLLPPEGTSGCNELLARGDIPPYGVDLTDTHHATCWRVFHIRQLADRGAKRRQPAPAVKRDDVPRLPIPRPKRITVN